MDEPLITRSVQEKPSEKAFERVMGSIKAGWVVKAEVIGMRVMERTLDGETEAGRVRTSKPPAPLDGI